MHESFKKAKKDYVTLCLNHSPQSVTYYLNVPPKTLKLNTNIDENLGWLYSAMISSYNEAAFSYELAFNIRDVSTYLLLTFELCGIEVIFFELFAIPHPIFQLKNENRNFLIIEKSSSR